MATRWQTYDQEELEQQYNARESVSDFDAEIARYRQLSAECYDSCQVFRDLSYGTVETQKIDYFPAGPNAPVLIFVHGGYWRLLGRGDSAFMVKALANVGISSAIVEYTLAPEATLEQIVEEVRSAVAWIFKNVANYGGDPTRLVISGSSAGAHLAAITLTSEWQSALGLPKDVLKAGLLLSGLYDLEPVRHCKPNEWLRLDQDSAAKASPQELTYEPGPKVHLSWGGQETDEFKRQSRDFFAKLEASGIDATCSEIADRNHFDIVTDLADPDSALFKQLVSMI